MSHLVAACIILAGMLPLRTDADQPCISHECSNDAAVPAVYGDEFMTWNPVPDADRYDVGVGEPIPELCDQTTETRWSPYKAAGCFTHGGQNRP